MRKSDDALRPPANTNTNTNTNTNRNRNRNTNTSMKDALLAHACGWDG